MSSLTCPKLAPFLLALPSSQRARSHYLLPCSQVGGQEHLKAKSNLLQPLQMEAQDNNLPPFPLPSQIQEICKKIWSFISVTSVTPSNHCYNCSMGMKLTAWSRDINTIWISRSSLSNRLKTTILKRTTSLMQFLATKISIYLQNLSSLALRFLKVTGSTEHNFNKSQMWNNKKNEESPEILVGRSYNPLKKLI